MSSEFYLHSMELTDIINFIKENSEYYAKVDFSGHSEAQIRRIYHILKFEKDAKSKIKDIEPYIQGFHFF